MTATILDDAGRPVEGEPLALYFVLDGAAGAIELPWDPSKVQRTNTEGKTTFEVSPRSGKVVKLVPRIGGRQGFALNRSVIVRGR